MREQYRQDVLDILRNVTGREIGVIDSDVEFKDQIDLDSMDFFDLVMEVREKYSLDLPPETTYANFETMNKLVDFLEVRVGS